MKNEFRLSLSKHLSLEGKVKNYVENLLDNLYIEINNYQVEPINNLIARNTLEGWCWQTTETTILFFPDETLIMRGNLEFSKTKLYYHSWIVFNYLQHDYVFDPCLNIILLKKVFDFLFQPEVFSVIKASQVKQAFWQKYLTCENNSFEVWGSEDVFDPMYNNTSFYTANITNNQLLSLIAHYNLPRKKR